MKTFAGEIILFIASCCFLNAGCSYDQRDDPCFHSAVSYSSDIAPVITTHCTWVGCHASGSPVGYLGDYDTLKQTIDNGTFYTMVFDLQIMPPGDPLNDGELQLIKCWLEAGAPEN